MRHLKLVFVGENNVGKTSLLITTTSGSFPSEYIPTVFDNYSAQWEFNGQKFLIGLWDTAGATDYDRLRPLSYPQTDIFIFCFDLNQRESLQHLKNRWIEEISHHCPNAMIVVWGNKLDLLQRKKPIIRWIQKETQHHRKEKSWKRLLSRWFSFSSSSSSSSSSSKTIMIMCPGLHEDSYSRIIAQSLLDHVNDSHNTLNNLELLMVQYRGTKAIPQRIVFPEMIADILKSISYVQECYHPYNEQVHIFLLGCGVGAGLALAAARRAPYRSVSGIHVINGMYCGKRFLWSHLGKEGLLKYIHNIANHSGGPNQVVDYNEVYPANSKNNAFHCQHLTHSSHDHNFVSSSSLDECNSISEESELNTSNDIKNGMEKFEEEKDVNENQEEEEEEKNKSSKVIDVVEENDDKIVHILEKPIPQLTKDSLIIGEIDWERRLDHMQQHHGQHILSQAFLQIADLETLSFHLSTHVCNIDLNTKSIDTATIEKAQSLANQIIHDRRSVDIGHYSPHDASQLPDMRQKDLSGLKGDSVRIVSVNKFDRQPCCGTHPPDSGFVGSVVVLGTEKVKKTTRLYFICGNRVTNYAFDSARTFRSMASKMRCGPQMTEVEKALDQKLASANSLRKQLTEYEKIVNRVVAEEICHESTRTEHLRVCVSVLENRDVKDLKKLAKEKHFHTEPTVGMLLSKSDDACPFVIFGSDDLKQSEIDMRTLMKMMLAKHKGRGGGSKIFVQGSFHTNNEEPIVKDVRSALEGLSVSSNE
eukprot:gb/GECH01012629.1/.p1 GENE.gb/GECH01012629.1/~~gb/GECH01012629.1/.p1  ORF type:complete len:758 (+),score=163.83 gb/GECH01012629.1/:1-2274(+)